MDKSSKTMDNKKPGINYIRHNAADKKKNFYTRFGEKLFEMHKRPPEGSEEAKSIVKGDETTRLFREASHKTLKFEDIPYGDLQNLDSHPTTANHTRGKENTQEFNTDTKKRTTLRDEIIISNQFKMKVPGYYERKNFDLMRIVEDQVRN